MDTVTIALIGVILSALGITGDFIYNARSIQQNTRTRYYQIQKDLEKEFHETIVSLVDNPRTRALRVANFAVSLVKIIDRKMMPKEYIFPHYDSIFEEALWIYNNRIIKSDRGGLLEEREMIEKFCVENKIKEQKPQELE